MSVYKENINSKERREARKKRRIRNQIICWIVLIVLVGGIAVGGYLGVKHLWDNRKNTGAQPDQVVSEDIASESENETGVIATPDEEEEAIFVEEEEEEIEAPVNERAKEYVANMSLEQKVASLFIISPEALTGVDAAVKAGDGTKNALAQYAVCGLLYSGKNIKSADQLKEMLAGTSEMYKELYNCDVWLAVQEEGAVNTIAGSATGVTAMKAASEIGAGGDSAESYQSFVTIGSYLKEYGINLNVGVPADVLIDESSFINKRAFGTDSAIVADMVKQAVDGQKEMDVLPVLTGFLGRGAAGNDTASAACTAEISSDLVKESLLAPFKEGVKEGASLIQLSNVTVPEVTGELPCSLSPDAVALIREEVGFEGVILTERLDESAITDKYSSGEAAVMAICGGADVIYMPANFTEAYEAVKTAINDGTISEERIDQSLMRIYTLKFPE